MESVDELARLGSLDTLYAHIERTLFKHQFRNFLYTVTPPFYEINSNTASPVLLSNYCPDWMRHYSENRYELYDVSFQHCVEGNSDIMVWNKHARFYTMTPKQKGVFREANSVGIKQGVTLPMFHHPGVIAAAGVTFDAELAQVDVFLSARLKGLAAYLYAVNDLVLERFIPHFSKPFQGALTDKQKEVLLWLSAGYTYSQISDRLNVGESTVRKHVQQLLVKLNAKNSCEAVALGVRWGLFG